MNNVDLNINAEAIFRCWDVGNLVQQIVNNPDRYGPNAVLEMAAKVKRDASELYAFGCMAEAFPDKEKLRAIVTRAANAESWLNHQHLLVLSRIQDEELRNQFLELTISQKLYAADLEEQVKAELTRKRQLKN